MAQGTHKLKSKSVDSKKKNRVKKNQTKKGARFIAPKKMRVVEQAKLKKGLDKAIKANIEQEITMKVKSVEGKAFHILSIPSSSDSKPKQSSDSVFQK